MRNAMSWAGFGLRTAAIVLLWVAAILAISGVFGSPV